MSVCVAIAIGVIVGCAGFAVTAVFYLQSELFRLQREIDELGRNGARSARPEAANS